MSAHPPLDPPYWWACQWPERKPEFGKTRAHRDCEACAIYKVAACSNYDGTWLGFVGERLSGARVWCEVVP